MLKIGHRGAKGYEAENTLTSFNKAIELNVNGIELDVHLSLNGEVVVIHDETIDRTTSKKGFVKDFTSSQLKELGIPTLEDVFNLIDQKCIINIEIKDAKATQKVIQLIEKYLFEFAWNYNLFQISSFNFDVLEEVSQSNPSIQIGVLTENSIEIALHFAKKIKAYSINPFYKLLTQENVTLMQQNGFSVFAWTVNTPEDIIFVKSLNLDGIISDFPDKI